MGALKVIVAILVVYLASEVRPLLLSRRDCSAQRMGSLDVFSNGSMVCSDKDGISPCPPGLFCEGGFCKCGVYPYKLMTCNGTSSLLTHCYATFDENKNIIVVGDRTIEGIANRPPNRSYNVLPRNAYCLNDFTCNATNRTGILCGSCRPDHYPLAYSFDVTCIPCPHPHWNWVRYIMAAYLPLTLFYFFIVFFKINTTSNQLSAVAFCQTLAMPLVVRDLKQTVMGVFSHSGLITFNLFASLYGIWNLDFFRPFYSDICLGIGILPTLALDYAIAVYPLLLMIISYLLIVLYDRNYRVITIMWRPFRFFSSFFRRNWDLRTSVVDSFVTFFFLSNMKFLSVSFDLLMPAKAYELYPDHYNSTVKLYYAGDVEYFGSDHLPYAVLAIAVLCVFFFLPVAIIGLYPFRWFQNLLNIFPFRWYVLHTFIDPFYGFYKNGTQPGVRDYRWCASVFYLLRFFQFFLYSVVYDKLVYNILITVLLMLYLMLVAIIQPFSIPYYNTVNICFLQLLSLLSLGSLGYAVSGTREPSVKNFFVIFCFIVGTSPLLYFMCSLLLWINTKRRFALGVVKCFRRWRNGYTRLPEDLPDRIENSSNYSRGNLSNFVSHQQ